MNTRKLGNNDLEVSALGLGCRAGRRQMVGAQQLAWLLTRKPWIVPTRYHATLRSTSSWWVVESTVGR